MTKIAISLIRELRELTGAGMIDCQKALIKVNGNIKLAIEDLRKSGTIKAEKKSINATTEGLIKTKIGNYCGAILEINCQTDFTTRNTHFQKFSDKIINTILVKKITDIDILKTYFEKERINLIAKVGENINIRRIAILNGKLINHYLHHSARIGVLIAAEGENNEIIKQIAMHIAARKPEFISTKNIPIEIIEKEYQIQSSIAMQSQRQKGIIKKMIEGRMKKFTDEISLMDQDFIIDTNKTVGQFLKENNTKIIDFIRFEVGENINKVNIHHH